MKYLVTLSRIIVGNLFIFSGVVKANDPLGFSYKLEEYFVAFGMDWGWLHDILVPLAAILCIAEVIMGVAVLVGWKMKEISWALLLMIIFFTILTGASAIFGIVKSCGCFGDAIPLTPVQSFYKDLILLVFILIIFALRKKIEPWESTAHLIAVYVVSAIIMVLLGMMLQWNMEIIAFSMLFLAIGVKFVSKNKDTTATSAVVLSLLYSLYLTIGAVTHLPFKDFRPYAETKNLPEQMTLPEGAKEPIYENILTYKNKTTGESKEFTTAEYTASKIWEDKNWEWESTESELIEAGDEAKITDLSILTHNNEEITDQVLAENKVLWIVCYDLNKTSIANLEAINQLAKDAAAKGIKVYGLSSAGEKQKNEFIQNNQLDFDFYVTDGIVLKTMIRSNPGIIYLEQGTVKGKWHENDTPDFAEIQAK